MKTLIFILIFFNTLLSQQKMPSVEGISDSNIVRIFNNISILEVKRALEFVVKIFSVGDESGSANRESCAITEKVYIAVSEYGEHPLEKLYRLESLYSPRIESIVPEGDTVVILFSYIESQDRLSLKVKITPENATILNTK